MTIHKYILTIAALTLSAMSYAQIDLGKLVSAGSKIVEKATSTSNFEVKDLVGTWKYSSPAVTMKGDNALSNIGGIAATTTLESKLETYYTKVGLQNSQLVVKDDMSFTWNLGKVSLSGTLEKAGEDLIFNFSAFGKMKIGQVKCMASKSASSVTLTFDTSKLLEIAKQVSAISSNTTFKSLNSALSSYKDLYVGMTLKKSN